MMQVLETQSAARIALHAVAQHPYEIVCLFLRCWQLPIFDDLPRNIGLENRPPSVFLHAAKMMSD